MHALSGKPSDIRSINAIVSAMEQQVGVNEGQSQNTILSYRDERERDFAFYVKLAPTGPMMMLTTARAPS